jgi:Protein of unknown function (DUF3313)
MRAQLSITGLMLFAAVGALLAGCVDKPTQPEVINVSGMIPITDTQTPGVHAYRAPNLDRSKYHGIYIEPATLYTGPDADFGDTSLEDRQQIASMLTAEMQRVLAPAFNTVNAPAPGIVRIHLTLVGINESKPLLSTALRLTPVGLAMSAAHTARDKPAAFTGSINMAAVAYDAETGQVLAAWQGVFSPPAIDLTSGATPLRAAQLSTTRAAEAFRDYLLRTRAQR